MDLVVLEVNIRPSERRCLTRPHSGIQQGQHPKACWMVLRHLQNRCALGFGDRPANTLLYTGKLQQLRRVVFAVSPFGSLYRVFHCFYQALTVMLPAMTSSPRFAAVIFFASLVMASSSVLPVASYFFPLKRAVFSRISLAFSSYSGIIEGQLSRQTYCPSSRPWYCRTGGGVFYFSSVSTSSFRFNRSGGV